MSNTKKRKSTLKKVLVAGLILLAAGVGIYWYVANEKFADTPDRKPAYTVNATEFIAEFAGDNITAANQKYTDKIVTVKGIVSETEAADTTMNIKFIDSVSGSYVIFAFQSQHLEEAKSVKVGAQVSIKGSCSGGIFSRLRKVTSISFQRCALDK
jgi:nitrogenase subunit NifH